MRVRWNEKAEKQRSLHISKVMSMKPPSPMLRACVGRQEACACDAELAVL